MERDSLVDRVYSTIRTENFGRDMIQSLIEFLEQNPEFYVPRLMYTLELNRIEANVQGENNPAIFRKEFDEMGLIKKLHVRQPYGSVINPPKESYTNQEVDSVFEYFETDESAQSLLNVMLMINQLEGRMMACFPDSELDKGPIFIRKVNRFGVPTSYRLTGKQDFDLLSKDFDSDKIVYLRHLRVL